MFPPTSKSVRALALAGACLTLLLSVTLGHPPASPKPAPLSLCFGDSTLKWAVVSGEFEYPASTPGTVRAVAPKKGGLVLETTPVPRPLRGQRLTAVVRIRPTETTPHVAADFAVGRTDDKKLGARLVLSGSHGAESVTASATYDGRPPHDLAALAKTMDWTPEFANSFTFKPRAYGLRDIRPGWPVDFRVRIEHDMGRIPTPADKWYTVRIESGPTAVRFWLDDRLVAIQRPPELAAGSIARLQLSPGAELLRAELAPLDPRSHATIPLEGYANEVSFLGSQLKHDALPEGEILKIGDVPFATPRLNLEGKDHLDIGKSLFRHANQEGYFPTYEHTWFGSARRDPARIQLRVPNARYHALYLLAASDGAPNTVPLVTAMFYRPGAGYAENFEARVPLATADSADAKPFPVTLATSKKANLWLVKIPLDPGRLTSFADMDIIEIELTKKVHQFRSYPDPILYGWHQAGRRRACTSTA